MNWVLYFFKTPRPQSSKDSCEGHIGRFPDLRVDLLTKPSHPYLLRAVASFGFRNRLQWRVRDGFSPSSLLFPRRKPIYLSNLILL